jgi:hypothetical protein
MVSFMLVSFSREARNRRKTDEKKTRKNETIELCEDLPKADEVPAIQ